MSLNSIQLNVTLLSVHLKDFSFYNKRQSEGKHMQCFRDGQTPVQDASVYMKKTEICM